MSNSQHNSRSEQTGESGGLNRRTVLQSIGAAGVAGAVMNGASTVAADGQNGQLAQVGAAAHQSDGGVLPTGSQFFSFAFNLEDGSTENMIEMSGEAGLDTYEPFSVGLDTSQEEIDSILQAEDEADVYMSSAHVDLENIESEPDQMADVFENFAHDGNNPALIEPSGGDYADWTDENDIIEFAQRINAAADEMADRGFEFGYHNHTFEFQYVDGADEYGYDIFIEEVEDHVHVQLDTAWVFAGNDRPDPIHYIVEYGDKISSLHMKNWEANDSRTHGSGERDNGELTEIHEGDLNMRAIATAARNASDVDYLIYEYDGAPNPEESFEYAGEWLNRINHPWEPGGVCAIPGADTHPAKLHST